MKTFELTDEQYAKYEEWHDQQMLKDNSLPTAGERWTFSFTPCGLGLICSVRDSLLKEDLDLTEWEYF